MIGYIYLIRSNKTDKFYIGSTVRKLGKRFSKHKERYAEYSKTNNRYLTSFEILKFSDAYIELFEVVEVENKMELQDVEGVYIKMCKDDPNCVNQLISNHSRLCEMFEEYREEYAELIKAQKARFRKENAEAQKAYFAEYRAKNADIIRAKKAEYRKNNADLIRKQKAEYRKRNAESIKAKQDEYRKENAEIIRAKKAEYRKKNAESIKANKAQYRLKKKMQENDC